jgi:hypothetical protein
MFSSHLNIIPDSIKMQAQAEHDDGDDEGDARGGGYGDVCDAEESVAKAVDEIEDGIGHGHLLPEGRKHIDGVENPAEIGEWSQ